MSLIVVEQASLSFGGTTVFEQLNLRIGAQERVGLVGPNGSGKSTLLKAICGKQGLDGGQIRLSRECTIGYLPQDILEVSGETILSSVLDAVPGRSQVEDDLLAAEEALEQTTDPDEQLRLAQVLSTLNEKLERFETYFSSQRAASILLGLGFREADLSRPTSELSGGWKMRAALAGLLFQDPDVLFLDEPTNHLDVPSVAWLDGYLAQCKSALVLICHDRDFLNRHIQRVVSFEPEGVRTYAGNYDDYKTQRAQEEEILEASARNREREVKELERFVERFRAKATKARQAQSRAKQLEKIQKEIQKPIARPKRMSFTFPPSPRSGRDVIQLEGLSKRFGSLELYRDLTKGIYAGDRVAIVGVNGAGKTTLLKILAQELKPDSGSVRWGANVQLGYYAQHHTELLDTHRSVLEEVWRVCPDKGQSYVRGVCGAFLFSGDDVDKAVGVLSGGERARVLLARLLVKPANLLLMDEPTNHLDLEAAEALAQALDSFDGTLVFVSHNRSFVNQLATKVWDISEGQVEEYPGNLDDYFHHLELRQQSHAMEGQPTSGSAASNANPDGTTTKRSAASASAASPSPTPHSPASASLPTSGVSAASGGKAGLTREAIKERKRREAQLRQERSRRTGKIRKEVKDLESRIARLETEQAELEPKMADPEFYKQGEVFKEALQRYDTNRKKLEELMARWEHKLDALEQVEAELAEEADSS